MDKLALLGIILAFLAILGGQSLEGGHFDSLINGPAFIIVVGGTLAAIMVQTPFAIFQQATRMAIWVILPPKVDMVDGIKKVVGWSIVSRKDGLLGLEKESENVTDQFEKKALSMLADGATSMQIRSALILELEAKEKFLVQSAKVYEAMGGYAPTVGILGAVLGLIHVMGNLADPSKLGPGIATAFVATIYGVGFANLLFLPMANKLKARIQAMSQYREMFTEGVIAIADGENPRIIEDKLSGFVN